MAEWTHPRRAAKETISYLSQVEPVIDQFHEDDHSYGGGGIDEGDADDVDREQMLDNILEELKHQTASIMEDRQGSVVAEKIVRRLTPVQLRVMLSRCRGYMLSLANNRYSSHVLQTLLSVAGQIIEQELSGDDAGFVIDTEGGTGSTSDPKVDLMQDIILSLVSELSGAWAELLADISGSHVGRGFLQVLGGLPILTEKRGRQSRHAHSIGTAVGPARRARDNNPSALSGGATKGSKGSATTSVDPEALEKWSTPYKHRVPRSFEEALEGVTSELAALPAGELQALVCGTFGCPLLVMLLRVYGNLAVDPATGKLPCLELESAAMVLVKKALEWDDEERSTEVVYAISGENTASHFLEAVLWLSPKLFFQELYRRCFESKLLEFCEHGVSNFLIQSALQRADDMALAEGMVSAIGDHASALLAARRAGVLWRAAQACVRLGLKPKTQTKLLEDIARAVQAGHTGLPPSPADGVKSEKEPEDAGGAAASSAPFDPFKAARAWVPALLGARLPGEGGLDRLFLNVPGARIVQNALLFDPPVAAPVLKAVAALPEAVLAAISRDNMGSRCLLDPILEAAARDGGDGSGKGKKNNRPAEDARRTILRAFRGHLVAMACDRVAWHILLKCFRGVDMKEKRAMTEELAGSGENALARMSGFPSGRSVLTECMVERFSRSPHEWEEAFKNRDNRAKMLTEILAVESATKAGKGDKGRGPKPHHGGAAPASATSANNGTGVNLAPSPFNKTQTNDCSDGEEAEEGKGKEKRRRHRGRGRRGKSSGGSGGKDDADTGDEGDDLKEPKSAEPAKVPTAKRASKAGDGDAVAEGRREAQEGAVAGAASGEVEGKQNKSKSSSMNGGVGEAAAPTVKDKKSKRKRKESREDGTGAEATPVATKADDDVDLSFVMEAIANAAAADGQGAVDDSRKDKKTKKKTKNKKSSAGREGGEEVPTSVAANGSQQDEEAAAERKPDKKKRRQKKDDEEGGKVKEDIPPRRKRKEEQEDAVVAVAVVREPKVAASSEKKRKKSSGFRLF